MKDWFRFIGKNKRLLNFGFLFNFFSSFGQTFFISLFVPFWVTSFEISNTSFGVLYASVTILSAGLLSISGRFIDNMSLRNFSFIVFTGLIISTIILSQANTLFILMIGLLLVRFFGQGLMTHTAATGVAVYFDTNRGKALGFTALGNPAGQFFLPLLVVPLIALSGWQYSLLYLVVLALLVVLPTIWALGNTGNHEGNAITKANKALPGERYLKSLQFWLIASNIFVIPFIGTAVFLYQFTIGQSKGWDAAWVSFSFAFFAVFSAASLLFSGNLVDRYSGIKLFPLYLLPTVVALLVIAIVDHKWVFPLFYALLGVSSGLGSTVKTAMQVEVYGKSNLGKIRSYFSTMLVLSTALGPPVFGYFIDHNFSFSTIMLVTAGIVLGIIILSFKLSPKML
jgi:MFS family permease